MKVSKQTYYVEGTKDAKENYIYEVLLESDTSLMHEAAECLADTFLGIEIDGNFISEPVLTAVHVTKKTMTEFLIEFFEIHAKEGLTIIAKDKKSNRIVGVFASELYDPTKNFPTYKDKYKELSKIIELCEYFSEKYSEFIQLKTKQKIKKDEHIHAFMIGIKLKYNKKFVALEMLKFLAEIGVEKGYKSIFAELTNIRSQKLFTLEGWSASLDKNGNPIVYTYANDPVFKSIPRHISLTCNLHYKLLD
ncbi:TPA: hypothetical protein QCY63_005673 [Bacillus cereus]|nr:hypothetical protein [Bacillus cereus]